MRVLVDEILHAFESDGNLHLILGVATGNMDQSEKDIKEPVVTIIIPGLKAHCIAEDMQRAVTELVAIQVKPVTRESKEVPMNHEVLGKGLRIEIEQ
jgi:hypothetical protein